MTLRLRLATATTAIGLLAACSTDAVGPTTVTDAGDRQCFLADQIDGFTAPTEDRVLVRVSPRRVFELQLLGPCPNVDWSYRIGIRTTGGSFICTGMDAELIVPDSTMGGPHRCPVRTVRQLSPAEVEAMRN